MIRPRKMKRVELTVLSRDVDRVLEHLGKLGVLQPSLEEGRGEGENRPAGRSGDSSSEGNSSEVPAALERIKSLASYLSVALPEEPGEDSRLPTADDAALLGSAGDRIDGVRNREISLNSERRKAADALSEAQAFAHLDAPYADLEKLSYLTLRLGRIETRRRVSLSESFGDRAVLIPLGEGSAGDVERVLAISSRKGRFAMDAELAKAGFETIEVPEGFTGVPEIMLAGLRERIASFDEALRLLEDEKRTLASEMSAALARLCESYTMAAAVNSLKSRLESIRSAYSLVGWVVAERVPSLVADLERLTDGRIAVAAEDPEEVDSVKEGREKVPVSLEHGKFVGGFDRLVFSYGAPLYGTIDPTPFVAFSFTILFGLMFGDVGQGFVLLLLGLLADRRRVPFFSRFRRFSPALISVGVSSMTIGLLDGSVFSNEKLLIRPTRAITAFLSGAPVDRVLHLMPEKGSLDKLFMFFAFTIGVGAVLNSIGLIVNIVNLFSLGKREQAFFSKTGLSGALLFWYALQLGIRFALGGSFAWYDVLGLALPAAALFLGPALWRLGSGKRPVLEHGILSFAMEGFVELLESTSYYLSNTVSFLRVGAFALSHAVLSFIVFTLSGMVSSVPAGPLFSLLIIVFGNTVIILLEGLIVAIQTVRLQYYEFFSKFFTETGVEFAPFKFRKGVES